MTNVLAPFGLRPVRKIDGTPPNYATIQKNILYSDTTPIGKGDLVKDTGTGYIAKAVYDSTSHDMLGVFDGCEYYDTALSRPVFCPNWTGVTTALSGSVVGYVITDLDLIFQVQSSGAAAVPITDIGTNATFVAAPVPNTTTGQSTLVLNADTTATTSTFPMRIVGLAAAVGPNGQNDNASANNIVEVILNDQTFKTLTGI